MTSRPTTLTIQGATALLTLDDPDRRNILTSAMVRSIDEDVTRAESVPGVNTLVVTGRGKAFCAGAELSTLEQSAAGDFDDVREVYEGFLRVLRSPLATIAAVNGPAVGAGLNLALACDVRLASTAARFDTRFAQLRLHPGGGHTWLMERAVGHQQATLAVLFGERWDAQRAHEVGLVAKVTAPEKLIDEALALGARLDGIEGALVRRYVSTLRQAQQTPDHEAIFAAETRAQAWSTTRPAFVEHVRALRESISRR
ncbi:enoyl-CoA hydratase-related protein [Aeromicrobium chenweiae]|uniref:Enoyl-CoA hydratase n=1 Tax=Aeromicrobium chenweiae TaxID=2079793 RepID=A0A2S0WJR7_9ACTN|nr:enoyl-CoA hydratase-related protein [Aeromicrobium chenweiae]AWB91537.1 enoyl-CoA hydratase [Aeromicrobium chenweiae]TGN32372.1 enoyl-CoA hydratase [Aeromicrobium chenweiae]